MAKKGTWHTPIAQLKNKEEVWEKLEARGWPPIKLDTDKSITYFNNPLKYQFSPEYDRFFAYTKVFPLWDQRKTKDNSQYLPDLRENIFNQEKDKPVPVLTSFNYGLACRKHCDAEETRFRHIHAIADFSRRRGVMRVVEKKPAQ